MKNYPILRTLTLMLEKDLAKFYEKNNRTAGTRARKTLQLIKLFAQSIRLDILASQKQAF